MKTNLLMVGVGAAVLAAPLPSGAQEGQQPGPYVGADLGAALTSDARLKEFPGTPGVGDVEFDPGIRLSLGGGWKFNDWLRAGGEFGIISHNIKGADATFSHFPMLANVEFQVPNKSPIVPFFGGGPGVSIGAVAFDDDNLAGGDFVDGSSADAAFAWQAYGGLRYKINDSMSAGLVYKYFEAGETTYDVRRTSTDIRFGRTRTHSISASFSMDF